MLTLLGVLVVAVGVVGLVLIIVWLVQGLRSVVLVGPVFGTLGCLLGALVCCYRARLEGAATQLASPKVLVTSRVGLRVLRTTVGLRAPHDGRHAFVATAGSWTHTNP